MNNYIAHKTKGVASYPCIELNQTTWVVLITVSIILQYKPHLYNNSNNFNPPPPTPPPPPPHDMIVKENSLSDDQSHFNEFSK